MRREQDESGLRALKEMGILDDSVRSPADIVLRDPAVDLECALNILGAHAAPFFARIQAEESQPQPSRLLIEYCEKRLQALHDLATGLRREDEALISMILSGKAEFGGW